MPGESPLTSDIGGVVGGVIGSPNDAELESSVRVSPDNDDELLIWVERRLPRVSAAVRCEDWE